MARTRPWTMREVRALIEQIPSAVKGADPTTYAFLWEHAHGMTPGPKRFGPAILGPVVSALLEVHGVQTED